MQRSAGAARHARISTAEGYQGLSVRCRNQYQIDPAANGSRIHTGTFKFSFKRETVLGQNVLASISLTCALSLILAVIARVISVVRGVGNTISVLDLALVSVAGGMLASVVVLGSTLLLSIGAVRRGWDMDNLVAPTVSTLGDVITIPALFLATELLGHGSITAALAWATVGVSALVFVMSIRSKLVELRQIIWESMPVLTGPRSSP